MKALTRGPGQTPFRELSSAACRSVDTMSAACPATPWRSAERAAARRLLLEKASFMSSSSRGLTHVLLD